MKKLVFIITVALLIAASTKAYAQTDISMATHWNNRTNYNPASIARTEYFYLFSNVRQQWCGVAGAPEVINVQASGYFDELKSAFGMSLIKDNVGITQVINPMLTYAYRLSNNDNWALSMGLSAGIFSRSIDVSKFQSVTDSDPSLSSDLEKKNRPDVNIGIEFQSQYFILGLSTTHITAYAYTDSLFLYTNHRYGYAIYKNANSELFNYSIGLQVVNHNNLTVLETNANIRFKHSTGLTTGPRELFDVGLSYRTSKQMSLLFGVFISPNFRLGYAYDKGFTVGYSQNNTHEIMLEYRFPSKAASTCGQCKNQDWYR